MIDHITSISPELIIHLSGAYTPTSTTGTVRWNTNYNRLETAGSTNDWYQISGGGASISLAPYVQETLAWAQKKMYEDMQNIQLLEKYPELKHAREQYESVFNLIKSGDDQRKKLEAELSDEIAKNRIKDGQISRLKEENVELNAKLDTWTVIST